MTPFKVDRNLNNIHKYVLLPAYIANPPIYFNLLQIELNAVMI